MEPKPETIQDALDAFYWECRAALVDPVLADETRVKAKAVIEEMRAKRKTLFPGEIPVAIPSDRPFNIVINDQLCPPVHLAKPKETPDELVELAISRVAEACGKYWAEAKAAKGA